MMIKPLLIAILCLCSMAGSALAQNRTITGKVTSGEDGSSLPGVSIVVKGTSRGATTDAQGTYTINVPDDARILTFSFIGFKKQDLEIGSRSTVNVTLTADASQLEEVVVTALGVARQEKELGYGTATVKATELTQSRALNAASALSGKVSGLQINTVNNGVNPNTRVVLRGNRSLLGNNQALIVIDGTTVPNDALNYLNPNDIENVTVLKGANAAALYGSDASNGALIITTKKGSTGAPRVSVGNTTQWESINFMPAFQERFGNGTEAYSRVHIPFENQSYGPEFTGQETNIGLPLEDGTFQRGPYSYLPDEKRKAYDRGLTLQNSVSLSVGKENAQLYMSLQDNNTKGIVPGDKYHTTSVRMNASQQYGKFKGSFNIAYTQARLDRTISDFYNTILNTPGNIPLSQYRDWRPFRNEDGSLNYANPNNYFNAYFKSPFYNKDISRELLNAGNLTGNVELAYQATPWLNLLGRVGLNRKDAASKQTVEKFTYTAYAKSVGDFSTAQGDSPGAVTDFMAYDNRVNADLFANVNKNFGIFSVNFIAGLNVKQNSSKYLETRGTALATAGVYNIANRLGEDIPTESNVRSRLTGVYGDLTVGFKDYLFLHVSGRNDKTSLLSKANRSFFYPGADVSFVLSDAIPALKTNPTLSYAKVRLSATKVGQVSLDPYQLQTAYIAGGGFPYGSLPGYTVGNTFANPDLKPEFTTSYEVGGEFGLFNGLINLELAYYTQKTSNQTLRISTSQATGFSGAFVNAGVVQNTGFEVDLRTTPVRTASGFRWELNLNYSNVDNKVLEVYQGLNEINLSNYYGLTTDASLGQVFAVKGQQYPMLRVIAPRRDPDGRIIVNAETGYPSVDTQLKTVGQTNPKHRFGLNTALKYRGFTLSGTVEYRGGYYIYHGLGSTMWFTGVAYATGVYGRERFVYPNSVIEGTNPDGSKVYTPNTNITVKDGGLGTWDSNLRKYGENFTTSGDFWKLRELAFTYDVPQGLLRSAKFIKNASIGFVGRNLLTLLPAENKYTDPEFSITTSNAVGLNSNALTPPTRTYGFTVNLGF